jgi:hypothetical protein
MEENMLKLKEYLQMDTELPFVEFKDYYSGFIELLNNQYNEMDQPTCLKARFICSIVKSNAESRSRKNKINGKAFKKIASKCGFWMEAIDYRLNKEGLNQRAIELAMNEINKNL